MQADELFRRYQDLAELRRLVGGRRATGSGRGGASSSRRFADLVDDFYAEIERHPEAQRVITGGERTGAAA